jgi:cell division protein FtsI (penicillin-binding protein 3)
MTVNSLQLVMAMAALGNGGKLMRPYVVKEVRDLRGRVLDKTSPHVVRRVLSSETARKTTEVLENVVGEKGTGSLAAINGYRVAGKTGTSQKVDPTTRRYSNRNYVALFVGFAPVDHPRMVMLVAVDEPETKKYGGLAAAPVFREVSAWTMNHLRVNPDMRLVRRAQESNPSKPGSVHVEVSQEGPGLLPDFKGQPIREVLRTGRSLGLEVVPEGTGLAFSQNPEPGRPLDKVTQVRVNFKPPS